MTVDQLRSLRDANPFQPFSLHLAGGRTLRIPHRDFISIAPVGRTVIVYQSDGAFSIVDLMLVNELSVESSGSQSPGNGTGA